MERRETEAVYEQGRDVVVSVLLALSEQNDRLQAQVEKLIARVARQDERIARLERAALPAAPVTRSVGAAARGASRELRGERRIPAADYLIAAAAAARVAGVLHYDHHFDPLCRVLGIESVWITPPGTID